MVCCLVRMWRGTRRITITQKMTISKTGIFMCCLISSSSSSLTSRSGGHFCLQTFSDVLSGCVCHGLDERSDYTTAECGYVQQQQVHFALKLKQLTDIISMFFYCNHVLVSSIHTRCYIAVKPLTTWEKRGGTQRTTTLSALLQVKANRRSAILGAFQLPQGIIVGLWWSRQLLQMVWQMLTIQGNYSWIPASLYGTEMPKEPTPKSNKFTLKCQEASKTLGALQFNFPLTSCSYFKVLLFTSYLWPACTYACR